MTRHEMNIHSNPIRNDSIRNFRSAQNEWKEKFENKPRRFIHPHTCNQLAAIVKNSIKSLIHSFELLEEKGRAPRRRGPIAQLSLATGLRAANQPLIPTSAQTETTVTNGNDVEFLRR